MAELPAYGYDVVPFAMADPDNWECTHSRHFVESVDYDDRRVSPTNLRNSLRLLYSHHARQKIERLLNETKPSVAHLHNIYHQISPSILPALKRHGVPVLMTLHDLKLACPNYKMHTSGEVCERCVPGKYYHAILHRCVKASMLASALCAIELYVHRHLGLYEKHVDIFIVPSAFYRRKFVESGVAADKLVVVPNFVRTELYTPSYESADYFVYMGRLSEEKGLVTLLRAMREFPAGRLVILGEGPLRPVLEKQIAEDKLNNVSLLGSKMGKELRRILAGAKFTAIPSEWYENCPMSCIESLAAGKPVVGSDIGGIPELVEDGHNGLLFEPGNAEQLREKLERLFREPGLVRMLGQNARRKAETEYCVQVHMERLLREYARACRVQPSMSLPQTPSVGG